MASWSTGLLDFCDVAGRGTRFDATMDLARSAESLGYASFWLAEHYARGVGHANAPLATVPIAGITEKMRIGPAGMLMRYTQPLYAANTWSLLTDLFPDRIDFGLSMGAASGPYAPLMSFGVDPTTMDPLQRMELTAALLRPDSAVDLIPARREDPRFWFLGSSARSAEAGGRCSARYCLSLTHSPKPPAPECRASYLDAFVARPGCASEFAILVGGVCLPDAARRDVMVERALATWPGQHLITGDVHAWTDELAELAERYQPSKIVFRDISITVEERLRSMESFLKASS